MNGKVKEALEAILAKFESGEIPEAIAYSMFPNINIPSSRWSLTNRILMYLSGTMDARGIRQWNQVGRKVKKGAKAIYILAPRVIKKSVEEEVVEAEEAVEAKEAKESVSVVVGFLAVPVFRVEDTEGKPLDYERLPLPPLPLREVAEAWGVSVKAIPGNYRLQGFFDLENNEIAIATEEESVFFHELAHVAHQKFLGERLKVGQDWKQEVVAELSAAALCLIVGKTSRTLGNSYRYISKYAEEANLTPVKACLEVLKDVEGVLNLILGTAGKLASAEESFMEAAA